MYIPSHTDFFIKQLEEDHGDTESFSLTNIFKATLSSTYLNMHSTYFRNLHKRLLSYNLHRGGL